MNKKITQKYNFNNFETYKYYFLDIDEFIDIDECSSTPCLNAGSCFDGINAYTCQCVDGYTGVNCETSKFLILTFIII